MNQLTLFSLELFWSFPDMFVENSVKGFQGFSESFLWGVHTGWTFAKSVLISCTVNYRNISLILELLSCHKMEGTPNSNLIKSENYIITNEYLNEYYYYYY